MKFESQYWRRLEYPSYEKFNSILDGFNAHIMHNRTVDDDYASADPSGDFEHHASVIRFGEYDDVQHTLSITLSGEVDTKIYSKTVAPAYRSSLAAADYYVATPSTDFSAIVGEMTENSVLFCLAGDYIFTGDFTFSKPMTFVGEANGGTNFIFRDTYALTYDGDASSTAAPAVFKNIQFRGGYEHIVKGMGMEFYSCIFYYVPNGHVIGSPCNDSADSARGLIETTNGNYPEWIRVIDCKFVVTGPGIRCNADSDLTYEHLCAVRHMYKSFEMRDSVVDCYGEPTIYFYKGIVIEDDGTPVECKVTGSRIVTARDPIRMQEGDLLVDNCDIGRVD
jgi:hypothetical protein